MKLTERAAARIRAIMAEKGAGATGLRIGVKKGGCAGMEYTMDWAAEQKPFDEVVEHDGARVLIDPKAVMYLLGTEMDYKTDKLASQFVFTNPNQTGACGCGESVNLAPVPKRQARGAAGLRRTLRGTHSDHVPNVPRAAARISFDNAGSSTARASVSAPTNPASVAMARLRRRRLRALEQSGEPCEARGHVVGQRATHALALAHAVGSERGKRAALGAIRAMAIG